MTARQTVTMFRTFEGKRKSSTVFEHQLFEYRKNQSGRHGKIYLKCTTMTCPGRAVLENGAITVFTGHDHPALAESHFTLKAAKTAMKRAAEDSPAALKDIYDDVTREMDVGGDLSYHTMESAMRKRRRKTFPAVPQTPRAAADHLMNAGPELLRYTANFV